MAVKKFSGIKDSSLTTKTDAEVKTKIEELESVTTDHELTPEQAIIFKLMTKVDETVDEIGDISLTPGPKGDKGDTGATGAKGATGATGATGPQGPAGTNGSNGAKGDKGDKGDTGATGPAGSDASVSGYTGTVTIVTDVVKGTPTKKNFTFTDGLLKTVK